MRDVLLDTGPIVATLDAKDQWHARCVGLWDTLLDRCVTTEAVVTEACHLVGRGRADGALPLDFLLAAGIPLVGLEAALQHEAVRLMRRYARLPMDYADAGLVALADALDTGTVFTTDRRGFATYRTLLGRRFETLPSDR
ncbi:MAG TPA: PIN domain-containing protein [Gemmatimonadales bacterium]|nr:PIN domain-containing protein [Gemmatimonadales bacterium]